MQATIITGKRHDREDGEPCYCGCRYVDGLTGSIVIDSDTPKLAKLGLCIGAFLVPCPAGGPGRVGQVAYSYAELGLTAPAPEPERHEVSRLFQPAPTQMPGQLAF